MLNFFQKFALNQQETAIIEKKALKKLRKQCMLVCRCPRMVPVVRFVNVTMKLISAVTWKGGFRFEDYKLIINKIFSVKSIFTLKKFF